MKEVYILKADIDGTLRSRRESFGVAVTTEDEAKRFVEENCHLGYSQSYSKVVVFDNKDDALNWRYPKK